MGQKRPREEEAGPPPDSTSEPKKRKGFRVGPDNLPDGPWRRKVIKVKHELIHKAKVKKSYAKVKAREEEARKTAEPNDGAKDKTDMHPDRIAMLDDDEADGKPQTRGPRRDDYRPSPRYDDRPHDGDGDGDDEGQGDGGETRETGRRDGRRRLRPEYFAKELSEGGRKREATEARMADVRRREEEREERVSERRHFKKKVKKAHHYHANGQKKLGRESVFLLEKVKRIVRKS